MSGPTTSQLNPEEAASFGVPLTNLDEPLFDGAGASKRDLVTYLDAVADRIIPELTDRALSVIRVHRGQEAFMQKNLPSYTPPWVERVTMWAESSKRDVSYALCNDRRTLLWFANQRAVEYHPSLIRVDNPDHMTHLVLDIDPPHGDAFPAAVRAARVVRQVLVDEGLDAVIKTSGALAHLRSHRRQRLDGGSCGRDQGDRCPSRATGSRHDHHRLRKGRSRRQSFCRFNPRRRGNGRRCVQPAGAARRSSVVSAGLG
jgi:hypothetical protein